MKYAYGLTEKSFAKLQRLVHRYSGIKLTEQKKSLVIARLQKVLRNHGFMDFDAYLRYLAQDASGMALSILLNRLSTNHTYFNREAKHFEFLKKHALPPLSRMLTKNGGREKLRVWSAGCATGEEAYQLAMELVEFWGWNLAQKRSAVLATDISTEALEQAVKGVYQTDNVANLPAHYVRKYFLKRDAKHYQVKPALKSLILFKKLNLNQNDFPFKNRFHVIFCRNVMIYFDQNTKERLLQKFHQFLEPGGYLMIGHAESLAPQNALFRYLQPAIYQKGVALAEN